MSRDSLHGLGRALRLLTLRLRLPALAWLVPLLLLTAAVPPSYADVYPDEASRRAVLNLADTSPGMVIFLGKLAHPGTLGQLFAWETGAYLMWCAALATILMTASATRRDEEAGLAELMRGAGAGRLVPFAAPALWIGGFLAILSLGVGVILTTEAFVVEELSVAGAWVFAALLLALSLAFEAITLVFAQLARSAGTARGLGLAAFALFFAFRVLADQGGPAHLRWASPFAWRDLVDPYGGDHLLPIGFGSACALLIGAGAALLYERREMYEAYLPDSSSSTRRWRLAGPLDLLARLGRAHAGWWLIALVCLAALFSGMGDSISRLLEESPESAAYVETIGGAGDLVAIYVLLIADFNVLLAIVAVVGRAVAMAGAEGAGLAEIVLVQGVSRTRDYFSRVADSLLVAVLFLAAMALTSALVTATQFTAGSAVRRAWVYTASQGFGMLAALGIAFALLGLVPRFASAAWAPVAWSGFAVFLGGLAGLPEWMADLSVLGHVVEVERAAEWTPLIVQATVGVLGILIGWRGYLRRDVMAE